MPTVARGASARPPCEPSPAKFGIVMPMRDTPREREFATKSVPSAIALRPSEMMMGIDDGHGADGLEEYLRSLAGGFE